MLPVDVDQRMEFLSAAWVDEARRFVRGRAPNVDVVLCEAFSDPPPGIAGSWWLRIASGEVEAGTGCVAAPGARVVIHATYNRVFVRQLEDMRLDEGHLMRNPPAFQTLLGLDDGFRRSSFTGHDSKRMAYAGRLASR